MTANREDSRIVEASKSDLEDGEVSDEGAKTSDPAHPLSMQDSAQRLENVPVFHDAYGNKSFDPLGEVRPDIYKGRPVSSIQKTNQSELNQMNPNKPPQEANSEQSHQLSTRSPTIKVAKPRSWARKRLSRQEIIKRADRAIVQLQNCKVDYLQLVKEGVDPKSLKELSSETNPHIARLNSKSTGNLSVISPAAPWAFRPVRNTPSVADEAGTSAISSLKNIFNSKDTIPLMPGRKGKTDDNRNFGALKIDPLNQSYHLETQDDLDLPTSSQRKVPTTFQETSSRTSDNENAMATDRESREKTSNMAAIVNNHKPEVAQVAALRPTQSQSNKLSTKADVQTPTDKTLERKDYIARMLAAKAKKPLTSGVQLHDKVLPKAALSAKKNTPGKTMVVTSSKSSRSDTTEKENHLLQLAEHPPLRQSSLPPPVPSDTHQEAKKREQTELARKRIEELKNRSKSAQHLPSATTLEALKADEPSLSGQKRATILSEGPLAEGMLPSSTRSITQSPYFPPHDPQTTFNIPGLFMASKPVSQMPQNGSPPSLLEAKSLPNPNHHLAKVSPNVIVTSSATQPEITSATLKRNDNSEQTLQTTDQISASQNAISPTAKGLRKRSTAADFIEPTPTRVKRSESYKQENPVIIGSSDDENDESDGGDLDMDIDSDQEIESSRADTAYQHTSKSHELISMQTVASLNVSQTLPKQKTNVSASLLLGSQPSGKLNDQGGLRSKEEEIERMNRKIAEMEQRIKIKQAASRAQSPGVLEQQLMAGESNRIEPNPQHLSAVERKATENETQIEDEKTELEDARKVEAALQEQLNAEQRLHRAQTEDALEEPGGNVAVDSEQEQRQRRKAELESSIPSLDAIIEDYTRKLQALKDEEASVQEQISKQVAGRRVLQEELERLSRVVSISSTNNSIGQANGDTPMFLDSSKNKMTGKYPLVQPKNPTFGSHPVCWKGEQDTNSPSPV